MGVVYVKESTAVTLDGGARVLPRGEAWDSDSDVVKQYPHVFEDEPGRVAGRTIERATRAPGERRNTRAPSPASAEKKAAAAAKRKATAEAKKAAAAKAKADADTATEDQGKKD